MLLCENVNDFPLILNIHISNCIDAKLNYLTDRLEASDSMIR